MKFKVNYCYKDYYEAQKLFYKKSKAKWFYRFMGMLGLIIILLSLTADVPFTLKNLFWVFVSMLFLFYPQVTLRLISYLNYRSIKNGLLPTQFEFSENGVRMNNESMNSEVEWSYFEKFLVNDKVLLLFPHSKILSFLPRRVVESDKDWKILVALVKDKVKKG